MDEAFAVELERILDRETDHKPVLKPVPKHLDAKADLTLSQQWDMGEKIMAEIRDRVRRERQGIIAEYDRGVTDIESEFTARIEEAIASLEAEKRLALRTLADNTAQKLREHELLAKRMG
jgi:hypothetical protein